MTNREILEQFPGMSALVIGDICLDRWCHYDPVLAEREALLSACDASRWADLGLLVRFGLPPM